MDRLAPQAKDKAIEVMKAEVSAVKLAFVDRWSYGLQYIGLCTWKAETSIYPGYVAHASIVRILTFALEMVEPMEETRTELMFATEPVLSSLELSIPDSSRHSSLVELDEIEVTAVHIIFRIAQRITFPKI